MKNENLNKENAAGGCTVLPAVPMRIQRSRKYKQVSPNGLPIVYVGRPGKWGNPFRADHYCSMCDGAGWYEGGETLQTHCQFCKGTGDGRVQAIEKYRHYVQTNLLAGDESLKALRGKNLSCWCKPDEPCHADVLLELSNPPGGHGR